VVDGELQIKKRGKTTFKCRHQLKGLERGKVERFSFEGVEGVNGGYMDSSVFWRNGASKKKLARCNFNGRLAVPAHTCKAIVGPSRSKFGQGGGRLEVEVYHHQVEHVPHPERFRVDTMLVQYRVATAAPNKIDSPDEDEGPAQGEEDKPGEGEGDKPAKGEGDKPAKSEEGKPDEGKPAKG
jgi:hypothetical protein